MKISYNWLQTYFNKKLSKPEKVAEVLTMHSFEVEGIEKKGKDYVFDIAITPNRAHDCLSHLGIAKEISVLFDLKLNLLKNTKVKPLLKQRFNLCVDELELCRRYIGRIIDGVKVGPSPKWIKERLEAIGQKPINNIVDATNFVMFETGQPFHAFDADKVEGKIIVRRAKKGEKITTLDNQNIELNEDILIIADEKSPLAIAGIKGGKKAEITKDTKNIILEAANFEPVNIRKTSKKINLSTESSLRFENEISPELAEKAMIRLIEIILKTANGPSTRSGQIIDIYPKKANPYVLGIYPKDVSKNLGIDIPEKDIIDILKQLGFEIKKIKPINNILKLAKSMVGRPYIYGASVSFDAPQAVDCSSFTSYVFSQSGVQIPRMSVDQYFYGQQVDIKDIQPGDLIFSNSKKGKIHYESKDFLKGMKVPNGIDHCGIYLGSGKIIHATIEKDKVVIEELKKSLSFKNITGVCRVLSKNDDLPAGRQDLLVLTVPSERLDIRIKEDVIEEIARIFGYEKILSKLPKEVLIPPMKNKNYEYANLIRNILVGAGFSEVYNYSFTNKGEIEVANPIAKDKKYLRTNLIDGLNANLRDNSRYFKEIKIFEIGKIFSAGGEMISLAGAGLKNDFYEIKGVVEMILEKLGLSDFYFADASAEALAKADIRVGNTSIGFIDHNAFEINFEMLVRLVDEEKEYLPISRYPAAQRDIAIFVPSCTKVVEVLDLIENTAGPLLIDTDLFDIYENDEKKSFAFHLIFQSQDKTLDDKEINSIMKKIMDTLDSNLEWEVRR